MITILAARYMRQIRTPSGPVDIVKVDVRADWTDWDGRRNSMSGSILVHVDAGDGAHVTPFGAPMSTETVRAIEDVAVATAWGFDPRGNRTAIDPLDDPSWDYLELPATLPITLGA